MPQPYKPVLVNKSFFEDETSLATIQTKNITHPEAMSLAGHISSGIFHRGERKYANDASGVCCTYNSELGKLLDGGISQDFIKEISRYKRGCRASIYLEKIFQKTDTVLDFLDNIKKVDTDLLKISEKHQNLDLKTEERRFLDMLGNSQSVERILERPNDIIELLKSGFPADKFSPLLDADSFNNDRRRIRNYNSDNQGSDNLDVLLDNIGKFKKLIETDDNCVGGLIEICKGEGCLEYFFENFGNVQKLGKIGFTTKNLADLAAINNDNITPIKTLDLLLSNTDSVRELVDSGFSPEDFIAINQSKDLCIIL